jgi:hypothetical protein
MLTRYSSLFTFLIIVIPIQQSALIDHFDFDMLVRSGKVYQPEPWYFTHELELDGCGPPCPETKDLSSHSSPLRTRRKLQASVRKRIAMAPVISYPYPKGLASERNGPPLHAGYSRRICPPSYLMVNDLGKQREKFADAA